MDKSPEAFRTISEVSELLETPAHVLRFWESRFPQIKPVKRAGGRRYYRPSDVTLLGGIRKLLHDDGMTIRGVQQILRDQGVKAVSAMSPVAVMPEARAAATVEIAAPPAKPPVADPVVTAAGTDSPAPKVVALTDWLASSDRAGTPAATAQGGAEAGTLAADGPAEQPAEIIADEPVMVEPPVQASPQGTPLGTQQTSFDFGWPQPEDFLSTNPDSLLEPYSDGGATDAARPPPKDEPGPLADETLVAPAPIAESPAADQPVMGQADSRDPDSGRADVDAEPETSEGDVPWLPTPLRALSAAERANRAESLLALLPRLTALRDRLAEPRMPRRG